MKGLKRKSRSDIIFDIINVSLLVIITLVVLYPLYFIIIASISEPNAVASGQVSFLPVGFNLSAYSYVFDEDLVWSGYRNSLIYLVLYTLYMLILTLPAAYVLSKKDIPFKTPMSWFFFITMYFNGGLVPTYILMDKLGLVNNPLILILGEGVACYYLIISRQFFSGNIPDEVYEAADIDGATQITMFFKIALPLSMSLVAMMTLFFAVISWNDYAKAMIYIKDKDYYPLQLVLRNILILNQNSLSSSEYMTDEQLADAAARADMANAMKYSLIFIASAPLLIMYPFVQKYFVKGVMVGSVKG